MTTSSIKRATIRALVVLGVVAFAIPALVPSGSAERHGGGEHAGGEHALGSEHRGDPDELLREMRDELGALRVSLAGLRRQMQNDPAVRAMRR